MAPAQAADLHRAQLVEREIGNVDVQQPGHFPDQVLRVHLLDHFAGLARGRLDFAPPLVHLGKRDGRHAEQVALHGRAHGAGIDGVVSHVGAIVDAGDDQVGPEAQQPGERDVHAVGGGAVHVAEAVGRLVDVQGRMQRERVGLGTVVVLGSHHVDIDAGDLAQCGMERHDARRLVAVIVGKKDLHGVAEGGVREDCRARPTGGRRRGAVAPGTSALRAGRL